MGDAGADDAYMRRAIQLSEKAMVEGTGPPFGAVIVRDGRILAEGFNNSFSTKDPTAHAEIVAIRLACASVGHHKLDGCTIYSSSEPCPMCLATALWARVDRVVYAADRHDAATAGFDDRRFYDLFTTPRERWAVAVAQVVHVDAVSPFTAWAARPDRTDY